MESSLIDSTLPRSPLSNICLVLQKRLPSSHHHPSILLSSLHDASSRQCTLTLAVALNSSIIAATRHCPIPSAHPSPSSPEKHRVRPGEAPLQGSSQGSAPLLRGRNPRAWWVTEGKRLAGWQDNGRATTCVRVHVCASIPLWSALMWSCLPVTLPDPPERPGSSTVSACRHLVCFTKKTVACSDSSLAFIMQVTTFCDFQPFTNGHPAVAQGGQEPCVSHSASQKGSPDFTVHMTVT